MRPSPAPAYELRVALRAGDGRVHARTRLCWVDMPSAAAVLEVLARRAVEARRRGLRLVVEQAPAELGPLLALTGFSGCPERGEVDGPVVLGTASRDAGEVDGGAVLGTASRDAGEVDGGAVLGTAPPQADDVSVGELGG